MLRIIYISITGVIVGIVVTLLYYFFNSLFPEIIHLEENVYKSAIIYSILLMIFNPLDNIFKQNQEFKKYLLIFVICILSFIINCVALYFWR